MFDANLPKHVFDRVERRWAAKLSREAGDWRSSRVGRMTPHTVVSRDGRIVPVAFKTSATPRPHRFHHAIG
jgi:hypothetical protein